MVQVADRLDIAAQHEGAVNHAPDILCSRGAVLSVFDRLAINHAKQSIVDSVVASITHTEVGHA